MSGTLGGLLFRLLAEPATRGMDLDDPAMTEVRRGLSRSKPGLRLSYSAWYRELAALAAECPPGPRVELGSGGGFLGDYVPGLIRSDLLPLRQIELICRGERLPFRDASISALLMVNVLHHFGDAAGFLEECGRVLLPGGRLAVVEPWVTPFSRWLYPTFHPEPFDPDAAGWSLPPSGPLSGGNNALPWILFDRDRDELARRFPRLEIEAVRPHSALTHLLSGGVMIRSLAPGFCFPAVHRIESRLPAAWRSRLGLFATVSVRRR